MQDVIGRITKLGQIPEGVILATLSLWMLYNYTPTKKKSGRTEACCRPTKKGLKKRSHRQLHLRTTQPSPTQYVFYEFNGELLIQIGGIVIDTIYAPNSAKFFMDKFELKITC